jgi:hypothetical protein
MKDSSTRSVFARTRASRSATRAGVGPRSLMALARPETLPEAPPQEPETEPSPAPSAPPQRKPDLDPFDPDWPDGRPEPPPKA